MKPHINPLIRRQIFWSIFLLLTIFLSSARAYEVADCIRCHRNGGKLSALHIDIDAFTKSAHGKNATCMDCHTGVKDDMHTTRKSDGAVDCTGCHDQQNRHGGTAAASVRKPQCYDCHTRHHIYPSQDPRSSVNASALPRTCAGCHPVECGKTDYLSRLLSFQIASHPKGDFGARYEKTNCLGCHQGKGAHGEDASVTKDRCYLCHRPPGTPGALWGKMHPQARF